MPPVRALAIALAVAVVLSSAPVVDAGNDDVCRCCTNHPEDGWYYDSEKDGCPEIHGAMDLMDANDQCLMSCDPAAAEDDKAGANERDVCECCTNDPEDGWYYDSKKGGRCEEIHDARELMIASAQCQKDCDQMLATAPKVNDRKRRRRSRRRATMGKKKYR